MEVDIGNPAAPFGHAIGGDRRVETSREKHRYRPSRSHRHAAGSFEFLERDKGLPRQDFDGDSQLRGAQIHLCPGGVFDPLTHQAVYFHRVQMEFLVGATGGNAE